MARRYSEECLPDWMQEVYGPKGLLNIELYDDDDIVEEDDDLEDEDWDDDDDEDD